MTPYVNRVDGKLERFYISMYPEQSRGKKIELVYRPTHEYLGSFIPDKVIELWSMDTKTFYKMLMGIPYFRLPKNGTYDFLGAGHYAEYEERYERTFLNVTEQFIKKYKLPRLYEDIPYEYMKFIRNERMTRGGLNLRCEFNETQSFQMSGPYAEFARELIDAIYDFEGHTKTELFQSLQEYVDIYCFSGILNALRKNGVHGIKEMKQLRRKDIAKMLVMLIDGWKVVL